MTKPLSPAVADVVRDAIATIETELAGLPKTDYSSAGAEERRKAIAAMGSRIRHRITGFVLDQKWDGATARYCGIRSTSTNGVTGALRNWIIAARKRLDA